MTKIVVIQGHPDPSGSRLCHALAEAYIAGAEAAGHEVARIDVAALQFPLLRTQDEWQQGADGTPEGLRPAQAACVGADHIVLIYPLWLGTMPALLKGFMEQIFRPGVAVSHDEGLPAPLFNGKTARIVITMGMPAFAYRWYFFAHSLKNLERNILGMVGIGPIRSTLFGSVESTDQSTRTSWLQSMRELGQRAR